MTHKGKQRQNHRNFGTFSDLEIFEVQICGQSALSFKNYKEYAKNGQTSDQSRYWSYILADLVGVGDLPGRS